MKRILTVIVFVAMVLAVAPQVQAQDFAKMEQEIKQVETDLKAGKINPMQAQQKLIEIQQKYLGMSDATIGGGSQRGSVGSDAASQAQNQRLADQAAQARQPYENQARSGVEGVPFPGATKGWPPASAFTRYGIKSWTQPSLKSKYGETASYKKEGDKLTIYLSKNIEHSDIDNMVRNWFTDEEKIAVITSLAKAAGVNVTRQSYNNEIYGLENKPDPQKKSTSSNNWVASYTINFDVDISSDAGTTDVIFGGHSWATIRFMKITIEPYADEYDPRQRQ